MSKREEQAIHAIIEGDSRAYPLRSWWAKGSEPKARRMVENLARDADRAFMTGGSYYGHGSETVYKRILGL